MDDPVERALADLADADVSRRVSPHLEGVVLASFDRQQARGYFLRCAAVMWDRRREAATMAVAVSVAITIYFRASESAFDHPPVPERPVPSLADGRLTLPAVPGDNVAKPLAPRLPSVAPPASRPRTQEHRQVQSEADRGLPTWRESDDIVHSLHVRMPRAMLSMLGVPIIEPAAEGTVNVEVLLGNDGTARTIRIVP